MTGTRSIVLAAIDEDQVRRERDKSAKLIAAAADERKRTAAVDERIKRMTDLYEERLEGRRRR